MSLNFNQMYSNCFKDYYGKKVKNSDGHNLKNINKSSNYTAYADETPIPVLGYVHICGAVKRLIGSEADSLLRHFFMFNTLPIYNRPQIYKMHSSSTPLLSERMGHTFYE